MKKAYVLLDYFLKILFLVIFWFVAGIFLGYATVFLTSPDSVYNLLHANGFVWTTVYGATELACYVPMLFAIIFVAFGKNKKLLVIPMVVVLILLHFLQYVICAGILDYLAR